MLSIFFIDVVKRNYLGNLINFVAINFTLEEIFLSQGNNLLTAPGLIFPSDDVYHITKLVVNIKFE